MNNTMTPLSVQDRILVVDRRLFREDTTRLFVGVVEAYDKYVVRARGYTYFVDPYQVGGTGRRVEERVRLVSLLAGEVVYALPSDTDVPSVQIKCSPKALVLTDNKSVTLDLSEWLYRG
jgi:hypothetical protein